MPTTLKCHHEIVFRTDFLLQHQLRMWILCRRNLPLLLCTGPLRVGRCSHLPRKAHVDAVQGVHDPVLRPAAGVALRMLRSAEAWSTSCCRSHSSPCRRPLWTPTKTKDRSTCLDPLSLFAPSAAFCCRGRRRRSCCPPRRCRVQRSAGSLCNLSSLVSTSFSLV